MNPYERAVDPIMRDLEYSPAGVGFVLAPPTQQLLVAQAIAARVEGAVALPLSVKALETPSPKLVLAGLPESDDEIALALGTINGQRTRIRVIGALVIIVVSRFEYDKVQVHTGDAISAKNLFRTVAFVPQPGDEVGDRARLVDYQKRRLGRLDLRGFVRSEGEDASFAIEDIFQEIEAKPRPTGERQVELLPDRPGSPLSSLLVASGASQVQVVLGHPGSGKSFFLRWLSLRLAAEPSWGGIERPWPVLLPIPVFTRLTPLRPLLELITDYVLAEGHPVAHHLPSLIEQGRLVFLLDGLDEGGDGPSRANAARAIEALCKAAPRCRVIVTSRVVGYDEARLTGDHYQIEPLRDELVRGFIERWCELYALQARGEEGAGAREGARLADQVLGHAQVKELARTPLLLTIIALVHRAGLRLPDHRVELYEHALVVLVERWNRVRTRVDDAYMPPLKVADAARLLGPLALAMIEGGSRNIKLDELEKSLTKTLSTGAVKGVGSADELVRLFTDTLGLFVEQGAGVFAFLHLTLAEHLAARELVRTGKLEQVAKTKQAFRPGMKEAMLLAAGELGLVRADDARLEGLVEALCKVASAWEGEGTAGVPALLGGLLIDDPNLSTKSGELLLETLVPGWWFNRDYANGERLFEILISVGYLRDKRWFPCVVARLRRHYEDRRWVREHLVLFRAENLWMLSFVVLLFETIDVDAGLLWIEHRAALLRQDRKFDIAGPLGIVLLNRLDGDGRPLFALNARVWEELIGSAVRLEFFGGMDVSLEPPSFTFTLHPSLLVSRDDRRVWFRPPSLPRNASVGSYMSTLYPAETLDAPASEASTGRAPR